MTAAWGCMEGLCLGCERGCTGAMAARMMRRCGGALMGGKEQEGLGRTARWGRQARGRKIRGMGIFFCRGEQRAIEIFGECRRA